MADKQFLETLTRKLADEGKLIEAGWVALRIRLALFNAPANQVDMLRVAYLSGAQHLFSSIMTMLEEGVAETDNDTRRMELIAKEMDGIHHEMTLRFGAPPQGSA